MIGTCVLYNLWKVPFLTLWNDAAFVAMLDSGFLFVLPIENHCKFRFDGIDWGNIHYSYYHLKLRSWWCLCNWAPRFLWYFFSSGCYPIKTLVQTMTISYIISYKCPISSYLVCIHCPDIVKTTIQVILLKLREDISASSPWCVSWKIYNVNLVLYARFVRFLLSVLDHLIFI
jgi:hypothetical protein